MLSLKYSHTFEYRGRAVFLGLFSFEGPGVVVSFSILPPSEKFCFVFVNSRVSGDTSTTKYDVDDILTSTRRRHRRVATGLLSGI